MSGSAGGNSNSAKSSGAAKPTPKANNSTTKPTAASKK